MVLLSNRQIHIHFAGRGVRRLRFPRRFLFFRRWNALCRCRRFFIEESVSFRVLFAVFPAGAEGKRHTDRQQQTEEPLHPASLLCGQRAEQTKNARISTATMVEPTGVPARMETRIPSAAQLTDSTAEQTVTDRKFWKKAHGGQCREDHQRRSAASRPNSSPAR